MVQKIEEIIPNTTALGDCEIYFHIRDNPGDAETTIGPFTPVDRVGVFTVGRYVRYELRAASGVEDFRIGKYRAFVQPWSKY